MAWGDNVGLQVLETIGVLGDPRSLSWAWLEAPLLGPNWATPSSAWSPQAIYDTTTMVPPPCTVACGQPHS